MESTCIGSEYSRCLRAHAFVACGGAIFSLAIEPGMQNHVRLTTSGAGTPRAKPCPKMPKMTRNGCDHVEHYGLLKRVFFRNHRTNGIYFTSDLPSLCLDAAPPPLTKPPSPAGPCPVAGRLLPSCCLFPALETTLLRSFVDTPVTCVVVNKINEPLS